ncbi:Gfo/Idh/MocA family oxidoreductase [Marinomonas sp. 15G1-11]|uniref:Gfo/Idh/MocA family oxidoreductase n=1 Tax=Marinomonas phaeophyticola TaxID=3004091 RepID=A0ABT4JZQ8_9GAMM|nr:Gfo/Idh/MocA family oxidoreductase [Marinomonas sp. 15G1-11]MCZ2723731.1 Gfo/Idh/MocA family oxidoreductase [Marinomonas sp. 15G1-11]
MNKILNWGIIGTSFISDVMADAIIQEGQTCLYAVAGRSVEPLAEFAKKYHIDHVYQDYDALINNSNVDIIYIALPNHLHHEFIIKAANAGKAILCEKSLSIDMKKTEQALTAVADNKVFFVEGLMYLSHPFINTIRQHIHHNVIGNIRSIHAQYCAPIAEFVNPQSKGALFNLGCYPVSLIQLLLQESFGNHIFNDFHVSATGVRGTDGNICESSAQFRFVNLDTQQPIIAQVYTAETYGLHASFTILGETGRIELLSNPWLPEGNHNTLRVTQYEQEGKNLDVTADGNGFLYQVRQVRDALEQGHTSLQRPSATPSDSHQVMKMLTAWYDSHS